MILELNKLTTFKAVLTCHFIFAVLPAYQVSLTYTALGVLIYCSLQLPFSVQTQNFIFKNSEDLL